MNASPLNYSDVGYDFACNDANCAAQTQVHADGEIWSATNYDVRQAFVARYGAGNAALKYGVRARRPAGHRLPGQPALGAADVRRVAADADRRGEHDRRPQRDAGGRPDPLQRRSIRTSSGTRSHTAASARRASSNTTNDTDPVAAFDSPYANEATLRFRPTGDAAGQPAQLFVGQYEARATPIADTDPSTPLDDTFPVAPGTYEFVARGNGFGATRFSATLRAGQLRDLTVNMRENLASRSNGAVATGDGINLAALIDDTEATNWASLVAPIAGKQVTVRLDPSARAHTIRRVQVSALLRTRLPADPGGDTAAQNRFTALRQFEILACEVRGAIDCSQDSQFQSTFTSPPDAFPSDVPRPRAPEMIMRSFDVPQTRATLRAPARAE